MNTHSTTSNEGWIEWNGGECPPVHGMVAFRLRNGVEAENDASHLSWETGGPYPPDTDIIAYRIVEMPPETSGE